ncbi:phosphomannomutase/phosphoglucomutase [Chiayiivirga flava]|uniref:phosphomannomutase n=1 Tax=Chiayiivirga flava TaxID=659595 RepID=A0A7W8D3Y6_9GAMM|nr:phosphomannomutase/phosphoglucomutase [Chiayiivirga flava]MBB5207505.1 phosphomannomutase/phosphoglucomutase [Chiayiivirga flava]
MARKAKAEREPSRLTIPPQLRAPIFGAIAVLAFVAGAGILWQTFQAWSDTSVQPQLERLRGTLVGDIAQRIAQERERLDGAVDNDYIHADAEAGAYADAAARLKTDWPELLAAEMFDEALEAPFAQDIKAVGFAKLALLSDAATSGESTAGIVVVDNAPELGLAAPVRHGERIVGVAYAALPIGTVTDAIDQAAFPGGYLELRSGQRVLATRGDERLRYGATTVPVAAAALSIGTAAPAQQSVLPYSMPVQLGLGLGAIALGVILLLQLKRARARADASSVDEVTLGEAIRQIGGEPAPRVRTAPQRAVPASVDRSIFRAYDIRGVVGKTLDEGVARLIGQAIGSLMDERGHKEIVVGRDGRLSGPSLANALIEGLRAAGRDVIDIGVAPTPVVYFGTFQLHTGSGVAVTGSHNPPDYNGFKIVVGGETLSGEAVQELYARIAENRLLAGGGGALQTMDISQEYLSRIASDIALERKLKVVVDAGNGVAGGIGPQVLEAIGAEVVPLYCEVDGDFPNHHPDPSEPANLHDLIHFVQKLDADLGIAFDGDGDRLGVVTKAGEIIYPDRVLMLFARDVLGRNPGASVIYDVKCTGHLAGQILRHGGSPIMWKTGHSLIKAKMKETEAELAGEMSGHFFFRERWFGFDDGIYAAARLLEILAADDRDIDEIFAEFPKGVSTPELKVAMEEGEHYAFVDRFRAQAHFDGAKIATIDGIRADWPDGWGLIRCSNTTPSLVLRFDADDAEALQRIQDAFRKQILALAPQMQLPF